MMSEIAAHSQKSTSSACSFAKQVGFPPSCHSLRFSLRFSLIDYIMASQTPIIPVVSLHVLSVH